MFPNRALNKRRASRTLAIMLLPNTRDAVMFPDKVTELPRVLWRQNDP